MRRRESLEFRPVLLWRVMEKILPYHMFLSLYPPLFFAGIRVLEVSADLRYLRARLKRNFFTQNYLGVHFGGSLYALSDAFYMLLLIRNLGKGYMVWDRSATIHFEKAVKGAVYAEFRIDAAELEAIRLEIDRKRKCVRSYRVLLQTAEGDTVAIVEKEVYIRRLSSVARKRGET